MKEAYFEFQFPRDNLYLSIFSHKIIVAAQNFCQNFSKLLTKLFGKYFRYL